MHAKHKDRRPVLVVEAESALNQKQQSSELHMNAHNVTSYSVGELYNPNRTSWPQSGQFNYRCGVVELCLFYDNPGELEIASILGGNARFALVPYHDVVFLLYKFGEEVEWSDAPYSWWLVPESQRVPPPTGLTPQTRAFLHVMLINSKDGILKVLRASTLSPAFTRTLFSEIRRQMARGWPGDAAYDRQISQANAIWPTPRAMLSGAIARTRGGD
jgi:hypothetical protein